MFSISSVEWVMNVLVSQTTFNKVLSTHEKLQNWDFSQVVNHLVTREGYAELVVQAMKEEYIKFISLCSEHASNLSHLVISDKVDPFWHAHILFTKDYVAMAEMVYERKGAYLHHEPTKSHDDVLSLSDSYSQKTLGLYKEYFGEPPESFWPKDAMICGGKGCSCSGTGNWIHNKIFWGRFLPLFLRVGVWKNLIKNIKKDPIYFENIP